MALCDQTEGGHYNPPARTYAAEYTSDGTYTIPTFGYDAVVVTVNTSGGGGGSSSVVGTGVVGSMIVG